MQIHLCLQWYKQGIWFMQLSPDINPYYINSALKNWTEKKSVKCDPQSQGGLTTLLAKTCPAADINSIQKIGQTETC